MSQRPHAEQAWQSLLSQIAKHMAQIGAHPARVLVLLPYAQLMPLAARLWAQAQPEGFAPRFETSRNWSAQLAPFALAEHDFAFDVARDSLVARSLLVQAGLADECDLLTSPLLEATAALAVLAAATPPQSRPAWAEQARAALALPGDNAASALEAAVARIALAWSAASAYASDVLFEDWVAEGLDCVVVLQGFQTDPLTQALLAHWRDHWRDHWSPRAGDRVLQLPLPQPAPRGALALHAATDAEDEAQRAAACVLRHLQAGRTPVALVANDRALTRRIHAMLRAQQVPVRDETGWKLSTTWAAAQLMSALRACQWNASGDAVLDWLKNAPSFDPASTARLEQGLRKTGLRHWREEAARDAALSRGTRATRGTPDIAAQSELSDLLARIEALRGTMSGPGRALPQWLLSLRALLMAGGQWEPLQNDAAGAKLLAVLRLLPGEAGAIHDLEQLAASRRRMSLAEFSDWVNQVLEAASFIPSSDALAQSEPVLILPLAQLLARPVAALVLPGCDELRLPSSPEPAGAWSAAQRLALGLPTREEQEQAQRAAWAYALQTAHGDLLWRCSDDGGETLLPSPLVQALQLDLAAAESSALAADPRLWREVAAAPTSRPMPSGQAFPILRLSASAYSDLRTCPYRFFALRQLGLQETDELETEIDKRDFGLWLHAVLKQFHEALGAQPTDAADERLALLEASAAAVTRAQQLDEAEFLPFVAVWPSVRDGYLNWLTQAQAQGAVFEQAEVWREHPLGRLTLIGQIDRMDRLPDGQRLLIDYKTENPDATVRRIKDGSEDTQLAFYAALLEDDTLRAAYLNVGEREGSKSYEQTQVVAMRDHLIDGILDDVARIAEGAPLPALGEGAACEHCAARGLCRKDFW